jgi:hypothetical protein
MTGNTDPYIHETPLVLVIYNSARISRAAGNKNDLSWLRPTNRLNGKTQWQITAVSVSAGKSAALIGKLNSCLFGTREIISDRWAISLAQSVNSNATTTPKDNFFHQFICPS